MDLGVRRIMLWWGTLVLALAFLTVGVFGYIIVLGELEWYNTPISAASACPPPDLKSCVSFPQCGQTKPLMFSIIPRAGRSTCLQKETDRRTSSALSACGVVTSTAPSAPSMS